MAQDLRGLPVAKELTNKVAARAQALRDAGVVPTLAIVRVGARADDLAYERGACKRCESAGIDVRVFELSQDCTQEELLNTIAQINANDELHGCLLFRPLPVSLDEEAACAAIDPAKDVDCATADSLYGVFACCDTGFPPCTAEACVELLDYYDVPLQGAKVTVIGRSLVIGKPVSMMLQARNATVTMCHTRTRNLDEECKGADVLVVAAGRAGVVGSDAVREGQVVVDVGINWDEVNQRLCGDVAYDEVEPIVGALTPVPGGVGSVTTAVLAKHVVRAAEKRYAE